MATASLLFCCVSWKVIVFPAPCTQGEVATPTESAVNPFNPRLLSTCFVADVLQVLGTS